MKKYFLTIILSLAINSHLLAQFPFVTKINSDGKIVQSPVLVDNHQYKIIIEGTFSIWPEFSDCHGFDAAFVYDAPKEEIDQFRWPPQEFKFLGKTYEIFKLPKYVGDSTVYEFPPKEISTPIIEMSLKKQKGFRMNGKPIPFQAFDSINHKYELNIIGNGIPLLLQIIDSNYSIETGKMIPRYEDNCGFLNFTLIDMEAPKLTMEVCNNYFEDNNPNFFHLDSKFIFENISDSLNNNILTNDAKVMIRIEDSVFAPIKIECDYNRIPSDIIYLLDNSGSMLAGSTAKDTIQRIDAAKSIIQNSIKYLNAKDKFMLLTFNDSTTIRLGWEDANEANIKLFSNVLDKINAKNRTNLYEAFIKSTNYFEEGTSRPKILIVSSDFAENYDTTKLELLPATFKDSTIKKVIVNFALGGSISDSISNQFIRRLNELGFSSQIFNSNDTTLIFNNFINIISEINKNNCCDLVFRFTPCYFQKDTTILAEIIVDYQKSIYTFKQQIHFQCTKQVYKQDNEEKSNFYVDENKGYLTIIKDSGINYYNSNIMFSLYNIEGDLIIQEPLIIQKGFNQFVINLPKLTKGFYIVILDFQTHMHLFKFNSF